MSKVIRADLRRIFRKKGFWIMTAFLLFVQLVNYAEVSQSAAAEVIDKTENNWGGFVLLLTTIYAYLSVSADDARSNTWTANVGIGMDRTRLLLAKVMDCLILLTVFYAIVVSFRFFCHTDPDMQAALTPRQNRFLVLYAALMVVRGLCCLILSMLAELASGSTAAGILTDVFLSVFVGTIIRIVGMMYRINLYDYLIDGLVRNAYDNIAVGRFPWQLIPVVGLYIGGGFAAAAVIFRKKELQL